MSDSDLQKIFTKLDVIEREITQISTSLFGAHGRGGCLAEQENHRRDIEEMKRWRWMVLGGSAVVAAAASALLKFV